MKVFKATNTLDKYLGKDIKWTKNKSDAEILLVGGKKIILNDYKKLLGIFKCGVGVDNLPLKEAKKKSILVQIPSHKTRNIIVEETANFSCHLILSGFYKKTGDWNSWIKFPRNALKNKNLLVLGTGRIGSKVARKMSCFLNVDRYDIKTHNLSDLPPKLKKADCVSLHLSLNEHSKNFLNKRYLLMLKRGCIIVNTARGDLVDEESLFNISKEKNFMCIFDVFSNEPYSGILNNLSENQFLKTPHVGSNSIEFLESCADDFLGFIKKFSHSDR
jgi:phosphoglycerate dehydrogenase-like enzyme